MVVILVTIDIVEGDTRQENRKYIVDVSRSGPELGRVVDGIGHPSMVEPVLRSASAQS
jgi:hypothetical protein